MASWKFTPLAVALALLAAAQQGVCKAEVCDVTGITRCYWNVAVQHGAKVLKPNPFDKATYLNNVCATKDELPTEPRCKKYYDPCTEEEKALFKNQEKGYSTLQLDVTDSDMCKDVKGLLSCIDTDVIKACSAKFYLLVSANNARRNLEAVNNLTNCLNQSAVKCVGMHNEHRKDYIESMAKAMAQLFWHDEEPTPTPKPEPTTTQEPTQTTTEPTSTTSEPTQTTSESTSTTSEPTPTTHEPSPTTPAPTHGPEPTTTPAPSGAAHSVPVFSGLGLIVLTWMARAA